MAFADEPMKHVPDHDAPAAPGIHAGSGNARLAPSAPSPNAALYSTLAARGRYVPRIAPRIQRSAVSTSTLTKSGSTGTPCRANSCTTLADDTRAFRRLMVAFSNAESRSRPVQPRAWSAYAFAPVPRSKTGELKPIST